MTVIKDQVMTSTVVLQEGARREKKLLYKAGTLNVFRQRRKVYEGLLDMNEELVGFDRFQFEIHCSLCTVFPSRRIADSRQVPVNVRTARRKPKGAKQSGEYDLLDRMSTTALRIQWPMDSLISSCENLNPL